MKYIDLRNKGLTSLVGLVPEGGIDVDCRDNKLTSLEGLPQGVKTVCCEYNKLTSLEGLPKGVRKVWCGFNPNLTSLEGLPEGTKIWCDNTPVYIQALLQGRVNKRYKGLVEIIKYIK